MMMRDGNKELKQDSDEMNVYFISVYGNINS